MSLILGLGVARLLASSVDVFRSRHHAVMDWMPLVWAGIVFLWQLQYWWAIIELPEIIQVWTLVHFLILVTLALLLFVAGALVLPGGPLKPGENLADSFNQDGRWAVACLSGYFILAIYADWFLWDQSVFSYSGALLVALAILPIVFLNARSRNSQVGITLVYVALSLWTAHELSPESYG